MTAPADGLTIAPVARDAAVYAVTHWHYSEKMPSGRLILLGVWEHGHYIGCIMYGRGANNRIASPYGMKQTEVVELVRVALRKHDAPVSRIVAVSLRHLKRHNPGLRLIVSYADPEQGHHGGIYQAGNWVYVGKSKAQAELLINGTVVHKRTAHAAYGTASPEKITALTGKTVTWSPVLWKHTYVMPLDRGARRLLTARALPYPPPMR